jgi:hypothetical protein
MTIVDFRRPPAKPGIWLARKPKVRIADETVNITSGSLLDWPDTTLGTASWLPREGYVQPSPEESGDYAFIATGTSMMDIATRVEQTSDRPAIDYEMLQLQAAARSGNERAFIAAYHTTDWSRRSADDFLQAIQWALAAGAHLAARNLSTRGADRYPDHDELQKYARVLAPPKIIQRNLPPRPDLRANRDWLMRHGDLYRGQWVALRNGELLGSAPSLQTLVAKIGDTKSILVTKVF